MPLETIRFLDDDKYKNGISSMLSSARVWASVI